jgi:hypothetical protein
MNARLLTAARLHSQEMLANAFQGHMGTNGSTPAQRISAQNYDWMMIGENIFAYASSVEHGHAAFEVDWGMTNTKGGMQDPPGHRLSIHNPDFREVGVGMALGRNGGVGPEVVTQNFGTSLSSDRYITGVAYYDFNGNNFYDAGEGIGGVRVHTTGSSFYAITSLSGGYALPVPADGNYNVTFLANELPEARFEITITQGRNVKLDYVPTYVPSVISGSRRPGVGHENRYTFTPVGGAAGYKWRRSKIVPIEGLVEGAEQGTAKVIAEVTPGYEIVNSVLYASGQHSFRLAHPEPVSQSLTLNRVFRLGAAAELVFAKQLGWASTSQVARAQISSNNGADWQTVWSQAGTGTSGELEFSTQRVPLSQWEGKEVLVRFRYDLTSGSFYQQTTPGVGFYLDDITLLNAGELAQQVVADVATDGSFTFVPPQAGAYLLSIGPVISGRLVNWDFHKEVIAVAGPPQPRAIHVTGARFIGGGQLQIDFTVTNPGAAVFLLQSAPSPAGPWITETPASISSLETPGAMRAVTVQQPEPTRFFRVTAN